MRQLHPDPAGMVVRELAGSTGVEGMVGGQVMDMSHTGVGARTDPALHFESRRSMKWREKPFCSSQLPSEGAVPFMAGRMAQSVFDVLKEAGASLADGLGNNTQIGPPNGASAGRSSGIGGTRCQ